MFVYCMKQVNYLIGNTGKIGMRRKKKNYLDKATSQANRQLLEFLFTEHAEALRNFLLGRMNRQEDPDDVIQEIFSRLAGRDDLKQRVTGDSRNIRAFLFTCANNYVVDLERRNILFRRYKQVSMLRDQEMVVTASPESIASSREVLESIKQSISSLPAPWRRAFILSRFEYLTYEQIAQRMQISKKTVEKYITRALVQLREVTAQTHGRRDQ